MLRIQKSFIWALPLLWAACGDDDGHGHAHDSGAASHSAHPAADASVVSPPEGYEDPVVGTVREGSQGLYRAELLDLSSSPPAKGLTTWQVALSRIEDGEPFAPAVDEIYVLPEMPPPHGHGTSVIPEIKALSEPGAYEISRLNLYMSHLWTVSVKICESTPCTRSTTALLDTIVFEVWVP